jgi:hypothetical protein
VSEGVKLQVNELGSWRNVCLLDATAESERAAIATAQWLLAVLPEHVAFRLLYADGYHERIERAAEVA